MASPADYLRKYFPFNPTVDQLRLFEALEVFIDAEGPGNKVFLLKGFAGTGKTSVISALVKTLRQFQYKAMLLAPTGRAAKVMSFYAKRNAFTIHKIIFKLSEDPKTGKVRFVRQRNSQKKTYFIIDEASMVNNSQDGGGKDILEELIRFVFQDPDSENRLILVGDTAQLPPVHQDVSPALDIRMLEQHYRLTVQAHLLTQVVRQAEASGILENATALRQQITKKEVAIRIRTRGFGDIFQMPQAKLEDGLRYAYQKYGVDQTSVICRTNRSATQYNQFVRRNIRFSEDLIEAGDVIMIVKNNYFWLDPDSPAGFLANGEFAEVLKIRNMEDIHGSKFADLTLRLLDYPDMSPFEAKVNLNTLYSFSPALTAEELETIFASVNQEYLDEEDFKKRQSVVKRDPYLNALQIKFAYALTCHKAQGGQWKAAFVDMGYVTEDMMNVEFMRWVYTAMTRASKELFLMNFPPSFFV